jgi:hypothetical protein
MWLVAEQVVSHRSSVRVSQVSPVLVPAAQVGVPPSVLASGVPASGIGHIPV